jgi:uncharacterized membrane protein YdjX (TVP38/TMEM64 family)
MSTQGPPRDAELLPPDPRWQASGGDVVYEAREDAQTAEQVRISRDHAAVGGDAGFVGRFFRWGVRGAVLIAAVSIFVWIFEPFGPDPFKQAIAWLQTHGAVGRALVVVAIAAGVPFLVPVGPMALIPSYLWGTAEGLGLALVGAVAGGLVNFTLARNVFGRQVDAYLARRELLWSLRETIRLRGFRIALGLRLSPVMNFGLLCYLSGIAGVPVGRFTFAMALGGVPWTTVYAVAGALLAASSRELRLDSVPDSPGAAALRWAGLFLTVALAVWIGRMARQDWQKLRRSRTHQ